MFSLKVKCGSVILWIMKYVQGLSKTESVDRTWLLYMGLSSFLVGYVFLALTIIGCPSNAYFWKFTGWVPQLINFLS